MFQMPLGETSTFQHRRKEWKYAERVTLAESSLLRQTRPRGTLATGVECSSKHWERHGTGRELVLGVIRLSTGTVPYRRGREDGDVIVEA